MLFKRSKEIALTSVSVLSLCLSIIPAHAQIAGDASQAALDAAQGRSNPIAEGQAYSQENAAMRATETNAMNGGYNEKIAKQIEQNTLNSPEYKNIQEQEQKVQDSLDFSKQEMPDTGIFSRIHNQEIREAKQKKAQAHETDLDQPRNNTTTLNSIANSQASRTLNESSFTGYGRALDALTLMVGGHKIILSGLKAPGNGEYCTLRGNYRWPCGDEAREATQQAIANVPLSCRLDLGNLGRCVDYRTGQAIQKNIALTGYALPTEDGGAYSAESEEAHSHHRGLYQE